MCVKPILEHRLIHMHLPKFCCPQHTVLIRKSSAQQNSLKFRSFIQFQAIVMRLAVSVICRMFISSYAHIVEKKMSEEGTFKRKIIMMLNFMRTQIDLSEMIRFYFMFQYNVLASFVHLDLNKRLFSDLSIFYLVFYICRES